MEIGDLLYAAYERRVSKSLQDRQTPRHVGVILDGNRRFAKARGAGTEEGHRAGAENIGNFLGWCEDADVEVVTLWLLSTDNLTARDPAAKLTLSGPETGVGAKVDWVSENSNIGTGSWTSLAQILAAELGLLDPADLALHPAPDSEESR